METTTAPRNDELLCARVVDSIAAHADADPLELEPLYGVVDLEALEALVESQSDVRVTFEYAGHTVQVDGDGTVTVDGDDATAGEEGHA